MIIPAGQMIFGKLSAPDSFLSSSKVEDSVEEKILALQEQKKSLSNVLYSEKEEGVSALDAESLLELFS